MRLHASRTKAAECPLRRKVPVPLAVSGLAQLPPRPFLDGKWGSVPSTPHFLQRQGQELVLPWSWRYFVHAAVTATTKQRRHGYTTREGIGEEWPSPAPPYTDNVSRTGFGELSVEQQRRKRAVCARCVHGSR